MIIECYEDGAGDPCYLVHGHVDIAEFRKQLAATSDYGEDSESADEYEYSHCFIQYGSTKERWQCVERFAVDATPITLAALWKPLTRPLLTRIQQRTQELPEQ